MGPINEGLFGLDSQTHAKIVNFLSTLKESDQQAVIAVLAAPVKSMPLHELSPNEMVARYLSELDNADVRQRILETKLVMRPYEIFKAIACRKVSAVTGVFTSSDTISTGTTNVKAGELDTDQWMLVDRIKLAYSATTIASAAWETDIIDAISNGHFEISQGGRKIMPKYSPTHVFANKQNSGQTKGTFFLPKPIWLAPHELLDVNFTFASETADSDQSIRFAFAGVITSAN